MRRRRLGVRRLDAAFFCSFLYSTVISTLEGGVKPALLLVLTFHGHIQTARRRQAAALHL